MIILCLIGFSALGILAFAGVVSNAHTNKRIDRISKGFVDFFTAEVEANSTAFNQAVNQFADIIAEKQALTTQAAIRGSIGGTQRIINQGLEEVAKEENPTLSLVDSLPKSLKKNPLALMGLQALMSRTMAGGPGLGSATIPAKNGGGQVKFNL